MHLLMDIDGTLTPPRCTLNEEMAKAIISLNTPFSLAAGSDLPLVQSQLLEPLYNFGFRGKFDAFLCNGAMHYRCDYSKRLSVELIKDFDIRQHLGEEDHSRLIGTFAKMNMMPGFALPAPLRVIGDQITFRGSTINFAPIGRPQSELSEEAKRNRDQFVKYDELSGFRRKAIDFLKTELQDICDNKKLLITLGGQTSFDIMVAGMDKTNAVRHLLRNGEEKVLFIGDALFPGGNDFVIAELVKNWTSSTCPVEVAQVTSLDETLSLLRQFA